MHCPKCNFFLPDLCLIIDTTIYANPGLLVSFSIFTYLRVYVCCKHFTVSSADPVYSIRLGRVGLSPKPTPSQTPMITIKAQGKSSSPADTVTLL